MGMPIIKPGTGTREESVEKIIESIAMEESAIAHILNAESEKLQAIVDMPNVTPQQLMAANKSVKGTVDAVIKLESALLSKLGMFSDVVCQTS